jgi:hypothetical protein
MKKVIPIPLLFVSSCSIFQTKQQQAELTVKEYIHSKNPKVDLKHIRFTNFEPNGNVIGVIENKTVYDTNHRPILILTVYYMLNKDLTRVNGMYTE